MVRIALRAVGSRPVTRRLARCALLGAALVGSVLPVACDRPAPSVATDSTSTSVPALEAPREGSVAVATGWESSAGPLVVLPFSGDGLFAGSVLRASATDATVSDTLGLATELPDGRVELFARSGLVGVARLRVEAGTPVDPGCSAWPVAHLSVDAGASLTPWTAAFASGRVTAIPLDSIEGLAPRDSGLLAANLTRLASALADDTSGSFRGLPFVVLRAWRTRGLDSTVVVATLARRLNQEDDPREERLLLVVEALATSPRDWKVSWHERAAGREEELVVAEPLLAYRTARTADVHLLFGRDDGVALSAAVLVRSAGRWRLEWESALAGCN